MPEMSTKDSKMKNGPPKSPQYVQMPTLIFLQCSCSPHQLFSHINPYLCHSTHYSFLSASNRFSSLLGPSSHNGFQLDKCAGGPAGTATTLSVRLSVNCDPRVTAEMAAAHCARWQPAFISPQAQVNVCLASNITQDLPVWIGLSL